MSLIDGLVSYWKMDAASGDEADSHGSNTLTSGGGAADPGTAAGKLNGSRDFDGSNDTLSASDAASLDLSDFSISLWFYPDVLDTSYRNLFVKGLDGASGRNYGIAHSAGVSNRFYLQIQGVSGLTSEITPSSGPTASAWNHAVLTYDATTRVRKLYLGGSEVHSQTGSSGTPTTNSLALVVGGGGSGFAFHNGRIDEIGLWSRDLSSAEVTELYNSGNGLAYPFAAGGGLWNRRTRRGPEFVPPDALVW